MSKAATAAAILLTAAPLMASAQDAPDPAALLADDPQTATIILMGDTNIYARENPAEAFAGARDTLRAADLVFVNLEGAFAGASDDPLSPDIPHKSWSHSEASMVEALTSAGIDVVGVANNVTYPHRAMTRSLAVLEQAGIAATGGGQDIGAAFAPIIREVAATKVGFLQAAATVFPFQHAATETLPGIAQVDVETAYQPPRNLDKPGQPPITRSWLDNASRRALTAHVAAAAGEADILVFSIHWGISGTQTLAEYQRELAEVAIDAGADLVLGHGPHKIQKIELYEGKLILYSVGQGLFDFKHNPDPEREGLAVFLTVRDGVFADLALVPTWNHGEGEAKTIRFHVPTDEHGRTISAMLEAAGTEPGLLEQTPTGWRIAGLP